jgi:hypothetical protein
LSQLIAIFETTQLQRFKLYFSQSFLVRERFSLRQLAIKEEEQAQKLRATSVSSQPESTQTESQSEEQKQAIIELGA